MNISFSITISMQKILYNKCKNCVFNNCGINCTSFVQILCIYWFQAIALLFIAVAVTAKPDPYYFYGL